MAINNLYMTDSGGTVVPVETPVVVPALDPIVIGTEIGQIGKIVPPVIPEPESIIVPESIIQPYLDIVSSMTGEVVDLAALLGDRVYEYYQTLSEAEKVELLQDLITWISNTEEVGKYNLDSEVWNTIFADTTLGIAITTDQLPELQAAQDWLRSQWNALFVLNNIPIVNVFSKFDAVAGATISPQQPGWYFYQYMLGNPEATVAEVYRYMYSIVNGAPHIGHPVYNDSPLLKQLEAKPNSKYLLEQLRVSQLFLDHLKSLLGTGYDQMSLHDFVVLADNVSLAYTVATDYAPAIIKATIAALQNTTDDESLLLQVLMSLGKYDVTLGSIFKTALDHGVTISELTDGLLFGFLKGRESRLADVYLGEGGMYPRTTVLTIVGDIIITALQTNDVTNTVVQTLFDNWPLVTADGVPFIPTFNGIYFFEPNSVGNNLRFIENRWDGEINSTLKIVDIISKYGNKIPYIGLVTKLAGLGFSTAALVANIKYGYHANASTGAVSYDHFWSSLGTHLATKYGPTIIKKGLTTIGDNIGSIVDNVTHKVVGIGNNIVDTFTKDDEEVGGLATVPVGATIGSKPTGEEDEEAFGRSLFQSEGLRHKVVTARKEK